MFAGVGMGLYTVEKTGKDKLLLKAVDPNAPALR
jgi:hypothetical protein